MIPNHAPMAAVYLDPDATGSRDGRLFSRPVVAWDTDGAPLFYFGGPGLDTPQTMLDQVTFLGLWQRSWTPSYDEMSTLLPEHVPGTPHPLAVNVVIKQQRDGRFMAHRQSDDRMIVSGATLSNVELQLSAIGSFHVVQITGPDGY